MDLFRRKSVTALQAEAAADHRLKRALGPVNLTALGVGAIIGTGIFVLTGTVAAQNAGPAVILSFVLAGVASIFAALCYSEFASLVPMAGSAYTYGYATLGEFVAWIIGWDLVLEYALAATTVAIGWSGYVVSFLADLGIHIPAHWQAARGTVVTLADGTQVTALLNIPAVFIIAVITTLLVVGIKESASVNNVIVFIKVVVILLFIALAASHVNPDNWHPFIPPNTGAREHFGFSGVVAGAAIVFFAYIGFDAISTAAEETKNPQRNLPIGILGGLAICTLIYIIVGFVLTGMVPSSTLGSTADPLSFALTSVGMTKVGWVVALGAVFSMSAVLLVFQYGQPRIFFAMARDGLLPRFAAKVHGKYRTPYITTIITGVFVATWALIGDANETYDLTNIGTLFAFILVCSGVVVLRFTDRDRPRPFRVPFLYVIAPLGAALCFFVMWGLPTKAWERFGWWLVIGLVLYFAYGYRNSTLRRGAPPVSSE
jgi:basic amino acid/polyamine antiporter, APA family